MEKIRLILFRIRPAQELYMPTALTGFRVVTGDKHLRAFRACPLGKDAELYTLIAKNVRIGRLSASVRTHHRVDDLFFVSI